MNFPIAILVGYEDGKPVYYKEGFFDSNAGEEPPTGDSAAGVSDGSFIMDTFTGVIKQYNKGSDTWKNRLTLSE